MTIQPKLIVIMGAKTLEAINSLDFPLAEKLKSDTGVIQQFTPTMQALVTPEIDSSLNEQGKKTEFWKAFRILGDWYESLPPY
jgi:hypothetical protein